MHEFSGWLSWTIGCGSAFICHMSSTLSSSTTCPAFTWNVLQLCDFFIVRLHLNLSSTVNFILGSYNSYFAGYFSASQIFNLLFIFILMVIISYFQVISHIYGFVLHVFTIWTMICLNVFYLLNPINIYI